ncbi:DUF1471 domain-containing protein [Yersinia intermedia]|uniref:DUF1471 domain-containing protein n=1 Tax=Yersinia intermedia TaxID=631 RepID=UPI0022FE7E0B|nr:DUF1471 domain-containing protein [Yersinia intermedia]MDA5514405.1 DUF1471 domain-containing protein [Yersinia intermedia]
MKTIKLFALASAVTLTSLSSLAQNVTATASTLDSAEAQIAAQAKEANADYKIITALNKNGVYMIAELTH